MTRAIRSISVAKGYDPADYVLVTFGGAGGSTRLRHRSATAACQRILIAPLFRAAERLRHRPRRCPPTSASRPCWSRSLPSRSTALTSAVRRNLAAERRRRKSIAEGIDAGSSRRPPQMSLDLRYRGIESDDHRSRSRPTATSAGTTNDRHARLYGYVGNEPAAGNRSRARVEVVGRSAQPPEPPLPMHSDADRRPSRMPRKHWFGGESHDTGVYLREATFTPATNSPARPSSVEPSLYGRRRLLDSPRRCLRGEIVMECEASLVPRDGRSGAVKAGGGGRARNRDLESCRIRVSKFQLASVRPLVAPSALALSRHGGEADKADHADPVQSTRNLQQLSSRRSPSRWASRCRRRRFRPT